jgi:hypothetical protein
MNNNNDFMDITDVLQQAKLCELDDFGFKSYLLLKLVEAYDCINELKKENAELKESHCINDRDIFDV